MHTLRLKFVNTATEKVKMLSFNYANASATSSTAEDSMDAIIAQNIIPGGPYEIAGADIVNRTVAPLL
jgi:hypothetical protein